MSDETSASRYFIFQALGRSARSSFVMGVLYPFEDIAKKVSCFTRMLILGEIVNRHGVENAGFFNIAELALFSGFFPGR